MKSLCLRLGVGTVTRALHAQPDRSVRRTARPFTHHLIQALQLQTRVVQARLRVWAQSWEGFRRGLWHLSIVVVQAFRKPNSLQCTPSGSITYSTGCSTKTGFPLICLPEFSFNANSTLFDVAVCTATTDQCSATRAAIRRPMAHGFSLLEVQPSRNWIMIWVRWESVNLMPLRTLRSRIDFSLNSSRACEFNWR